MPANSGMTWEKSDPRLAALFEEIAPAAAGVARKKMFGWPCCFVNGNLFTGLHRQSMIFRLSQPDLAAFLKLDGAAEFEPMPGRKMKSYGILNHPLKRDRKQLEHWIARSFDFARDLPAKKPAAKHAAARKTAQAAKRKS